jgi:alkenylglycerophosphocholine hydrolase
VADRYVLRVTAFWILVAIAAVAAVVDWIAVGTSNHRLQYPAKPAVLVALVAAAASIPASHTDLVDRRWWFVAALLCCLVGDVALMLPHELFIPGLAAFLAGHVLFVVGLLQPPAPPGVPPFAFSPVGLAVAAGVVAAVEAYPGRALLTALAGGGHRPLIAPVCVYMMAIATVVVLATNVASRPAAIGASLFLVSDTVLALDRFVWPRRWGTLVVHVTYHLAQVLLVLSLVR